MNSSKFKVIQTGKFKKIDLRAGLVGRIALGGFMSLWMTIWTIGCSAMLYSLITEFDWFMLLFFLPFAAAWFAGAAVLIYGLVGKHEMVIAPDYVEFSRTAIIPVHRRRIPFKELTGLSTAKDDEGLTTLLLNTLGKPVQVLQSQSASDLEDLATILRSEIPTLHQPEAHEPNSESQLFHPREKRASESEWNQEPAFGDHTVFINHGKFELSAIVGLLFINLFWNGIVSVFLVSPFVDNDMGLGMMVFLYIFLIPFVLIGLVMIYALLYQALEPFRKTMWEFSDREIVKSVFYFGFPFRKIWPIMLDVEMRIIQMSKEGQSSNQEGHDPLIDSVPPRNKKWFSMERQNDPEKNSLYLIDFIEKRKRIATWEKLTRGDADWIATMLEKEQSAYAVRRL